MERNQRGCGTLSDLRRVPSGLGRAATTGPVVTRRPSGGCRPGIRTGPRIRRTASAGPRPPRSPSPAGVRRRWRCMSRGPGVLQQSAGRHRDTRPPGQARHSEHSSRGWRLIAGPRTRLVSGRGRSGTIRRALVRRPASIRPDSRQPASTGRLRTRLTVDLDRGCRRCQRFHSDTPDPPRYTRGHGSVAPGRLCNRAADNLPADRDRVALSPRARVSNSPLPDCSGFVVWR